MIDRLILNWNTLYEAYTGGEVKNYNPPQEDRYNAKNSPMPLVR